MNEPRMDHGQGWDDPQAACEDLKDTLLGARVLSQMFGEQDETVESAGFEWKDEGFACVA